MPRDIFSQENLDRYTRDITPEVEEQKKSVGWGPYASIIGANAADIATTIAAKNRGAREGNPVIGDDNARLLALKGLSTAGQIALLHELGKNHPTAAKLTGYAISALPAIAAIHNTRVNR